MYAGNTSMTVIGPMLRNSSTALIAQVPEWKLTGATAPCSPPFVSCGR